MIQEKKKRPRRKGRKQKSSGYFNLRRLFIIVALLVVLIVSICAVGYVIFFRTVFAQDILPSLRSAIVFEEPNPPAQAEPLEPGERPVVQETPVQVEPQETVVPDMPTPEPVLPKVAIIIDDMGYDETTGKKLFDLPLELTYSFLPFAPHAKKLENMAHQAGKTIFLHLPLQPKGTAYNPGPGAIYLHDPPEVQRAKLRKCLQEVTYAIGVNNHMGSAFTEDELAMTNIMQEIKGRSLIFVDSITSPGSVAFQVAQAASVRSARRNIFLDNIQDERKICEQLEKLVQVAEKKGRAIGIGHPYKVTVKAIADCAKQYETRVRYVDVPEVLTGE